MLPVGTIMDHAIGKMDKELTQRLIVTHRLLLLVLETMDLSMLVVII